MGRNEIRFRRNLMSAGQIARHRNYAKLMKQHDRDIRMNRLFRAFAYFLIILILIILLIIVIRWEKKSVPANSSRNKIENRSDFSMAYRNPVNNGATRSM